MIWDAMTFMCNEASWVLTCGPLIIPWEHIFQLIIDEVISATVVYIVLERKKKEGHEYFAEILFHVISDVAITAKA